MFRFRASDRVNGALPTISARVRRRARTRSAPGVWAGAPAPTSAAADGLLYLLQGPHLAEPVPDDRILWPTLEAVHQHCVGQGYSLNLRYVGEESLADVMDTACAALRVRPYTDALGRWGFAPDGVADLASGQSQLATAATLANVSVEIAYPEPLHGLRASFLNADKDWKPDEITVYAAGFDASSATRIQRLDQPGMTDPAHVRAWLSTTLRLYQARRRRVEGEDLLEHLVYEPGDLAFVSLPSFGDGLESGHIVDRTVVAGSVTQVRVSRPAPDVAPLAIRWARTVDAGGGDGMVRADRTTTISAVSADRLTLTLAAAQPLAVAPEIDAQIALGPAGADTLPMRVLDIEPIDEVRARISFGDYAEAALTGGPLSFDLAGVSADRPATARLLLETIETLPIGLVRLSWRLGAGEPPVRILVATRTPEGAWRARPDLDGAARGLAISSEEEPQDFELRLTPIDRFERPGPVLLVSNLSAVAIPAPVLDDWTWSAVQLSAAGVQLPALVVTGAPRQVQVRSVSVFIRTAALAGPPAIPAGPWILVKQTPAQDFALDGVVALQPIRVEVLDVTPNTAYDVALAYGDASGRQGPRTVWPAPYTTGGLLIGEAASDGVLTPGEKLYVVPILQAMLNARAAIEARADELGVTTADPARAAYRTAMDDLAAYLATLTAPTLWSDQAGVTDIPDPAIWRARMETAQRREAELQARLARRAAQTADWTGVQGRPLSLFDLDPPANATLNSTSSEVVAARGGQASLSARFTQVNTAWQNGDASLSSSISSVSSTANGASASASTALAATTDINGRLAVGYSVTVNANGRVSGMRLLAQGGGGATLSTLDFEADILRFWNSGTSQLIPVMQVSGGSLRINGNLVWNSSIVADAVSRVFESQNANPAGLTQGASVNYLGLNVTTLRPSSKIIVGGYVRINAPSTSDIVGGEIIINGNLEAALGAMQRDTGGQFLAASFGPIVLPTAAAGSYNVGLNLIGLSGFSSVAQGGQIWVLVLDA